MLRPIEWTGDVHGHLRLLDQTLLPVETRWLDVHDVPTLYEAIQMLRVRGAPAIGVSAAYGVVLGMQVATPHDAATWIAALQNVTARLSTARPTAVNLAWACERMLAAGQSIINERPATEWLAALLAEAQAIRDQDAAMCRAIGRHGADLLRGLKLPEEAGILTHCNAGTLAVSEYGTALAPIYTLHESGQILRVYADETRPLLQGARLTAWELHQAGVPVTVICDNMAAALLREKRVQAVIVGADRIAANGDAANKIGTYGLAIIAHYHGIPFYVAAPSSTFDMQLATGAGIPIEQRAATEITHGFGRQTVPSGVAAWNPAFDVTPAELITAIICERGVIAPVNSKNIAEMLGRPNPMKL
jgi:methylthioribose-1-phosphate isomerase